MDRDAGGTQDARGPVANWLARQWWIAAIGVVALAMAGFTAYGQWRDSAILRVPTDTVGAPLARHGIVSLQIPFSVTHAQDIVDAWRTTVDASRVPAIQTAIGLVHADSRLILLYGIGLTLLISWGGAASRLRPRFFVPLLVLPLAAVAFDLGENHHLLRLLSSTSVDPDDVQRVRLYAQFKFFFLLGAAAAAVVLSGGGLRTRRNIAVMPARPTTFDRLMAIETDAIFNARSTKGSGSQTEFRTTTHPSEEPRVSFRSADIVGLALSGGGIRSATFNLGLLQELHARRILPVIDYISTVSGGGYVGGFLSAWLSSQADKRDAATLPAVVASDVPPDAVPVRPRAVPDDELFPVNEEGRARQHAEAGEVRHLREFSEFLVPRRGLFEVEMWRAVVALLAGLLPALLMALSMIGLALITWLVLTFVYACDHWVASVVVAVVFTAGTLAVLEYSWRQQEGLPGLASALVPGRTPPWWADRGTAVLALVLVALIQAWVPSLIEWRFQHRWTVYEAEVGPPMPGDTGLSHRFIDLAGDAPYDRWWHLVGTRRAVDRVRGEQEGELPRTWFFSPRLFEFAFTWIAAGLALLVVRLWHAVNPRPWSLVSVSAFDRVTMRLFGLGLVWLALGAVWHLCANVGFVWELLAPTLLSGAGFAATRRWMLQVVRPPAGASSIWARVQEFAPQGLAYLTLLLTIGAVGSALLDWNQDDWMSWYRAASVMTGVLAVGLLIDPAHVGLHAFYRERIGRAYLGARLESEAAKNRSAESRPTVSDGAPGDDVPLAALVDRPLHLVCCAANDLKGDPVETLTRGARSATLSRHGFTIAGDHQGPGDLTLGAAVTASAAAFNSAMGAHSIRFGPVVGFLVTALNLRLGLWVRHPCAAAVSGRRWPGVLLYREFFGMTAASAYKVGVDGVITPGVLQRDVHLSDGGHFENLGLYELVRRHCRYIIVSDCGADPDVAFDDLGNALRRIREDFGVEIQLDVAPLRPDDKGCSLQHVVVGSIDYSDVDHGVLIYLKPTLTGDEPPDVRQYKTRNHAFPHEGTTDQFYDEAQWESYRRLGHHVGERAFGFMREVGEPAIITGDWLFTSARHAWYPTPPGLQDQVLAMTARFGELERELRHEKDSHLIAEVFPEVSAMVRDIGPPSPHRAATVTAADLAFMLRVTQAMEDVWTACALDRHWGHPLNTGWVNLFARWTTAPTFRLWWPILAPLYSPGFQRFLRHRLGIGIDQSRMAKEAAHANGEDASQAQAAFQRVMVNRLSVAPVGLASYWWQERMPGRPRWVNDPSAFTYFVLRLRDEEDRLPLDLGLHAVTVHGDIAGWRSDDFFVPPSLWGAGLGRLLLEGALCELARTCHTCYVVVGKPDKAGSHRIAREDERNFVAQYRAQHFQQIAAGAEDTVPAAMLEALDFRTTPHDTVMVLDLEKWKVLHDQCDT